MWQLTRRQAPADQAVRQVLIVIGVLVLVAVCVVVISAVLRTGV